MTPPWSTAEEGRSPRSLVVRLFVHLVAGHLVALLLFPVFQLVMSGQ